MQFSDDELKMVRWLRRQHAHWRSTRIIILVSSMALLALAAWHYFRGTSHSLPLVLFLVAVYGLSYTLGSWAGRPEISLLLKLIETHDPDRKA